jgi:hypothetical protein
MALSFAAEFKADPYLYTGEDASSVSVGRLASGYDLVTISGAKTFILFEGQVVTDQGTIRDALKADYQTTAVPSEAERDEVLKLAEEFNAERNAPSRFGAPSEDLCMAQTGINIFKSTALGISSPLSYCYDYQTCTCPPWLSCGQSDMAAWATEAKIVHGRALQSLDQNLTQLRENLKDITVDNAPQMLDSALIDLKAMQVSGKFIKSSILQISPPMGTCDASSLDPAYVDALHQLILDTYGGNILSVYPPPSCLDLCPDVAVNLTVLDVAVAKAQALRDRAAPLANVDSEAADILKRTNDRQTYVSNVVNQRAYLKIYANVTQKLAQLHSETSIAAARNAVLTDITTVEVLADQINSSIALNNFALAEQLVAQFNTRSAALSAHLDKILPTYEKTAAQRTRLDDEMLKASYNLQPGEADAGTALSKLKDEKAALDVRFFGAQSLSDFTVLELNYTSLADRAQGLNDGLESLHASQVGAIVGSATQGAMKGSLAMWNGVSPMTPEQMRENGKTLPLLIITAGDVLLMLVSLAIFGVFAFVNKRIVWRKNVAMTWVAIFIVFFAMLGIASYGAYTLVQHQAEAPTSLGAFNGVLSSSPTAAIVYDASGLGQSQILAMQACKDKISAKLKAESNMTVKAYVLSGNSCRAGSMTKTKEECNTEMADLPQFWLQSAAENSVKFYSFYDTRAVVAGNVNFITACDLARVI